MDIEGLNKLLAMLFKDPACSIMFRDADDLRKGVQNSVLSNPVAMCPPRTIRRLYCLHMFRLKAPFGIVQPIRKGYTNKILSAFVFPLLDLDSFTSRCTAGDSSWRLTSKSNKERL